MINHDPWNELDDDAKANLSLNGQRKFFLYKDELKRDGHQWGDDAEDILRGFIWDESEMENI